LAGGVEEELLALRVLLLDFVAIFFEEAKMTGGLFVAGPRIHFRKENGQRWSMNRR
jgi:hypothetical protein